MLEAIDALQHLVEHVAGVGHDGSNTNEKSLKINALMYEAVQTKL